VQTGNNARSGKRFIALPMEKNLSEQTFVRGSVGRAAATCGARATGFE
jgi:hypothetical protein